MSVPPTPRRPNASELLDDTGHDPGELARSLEHVSAVDRWLGGSRAMRRHLRDLRDLPRAGDRPLRVLDVGTGDGAVLVRLAGWLARRSGREVRAVGVDLHPEILEVAAARRGEEGERVALVRADALRLPFRDRAFDVVVSTLTLHHFGTDDAVAAVREMGRVARRRVIVADLERSRANHLGARLLAATVWRRNRITRHDGPVSVLRSFTARELARVGREAGLVGVRVRRHLPFRLVLEGRP